MSMMKWTAYVLLSMALLVACEPPGDKKAKAAKKEKVSDGVIQSHFKSGKLRAEIVVKNGKKEGLAVEYYENGNKFQEVNYKEGLQEGIAKKYFETGQLAQETLYKKGKRHGVQRKYRPNGKLVSEAEYFEDEPCIGLKEYLTDGSLKKKYPSIVIKPVDNILIDGTYVLHLSLSERAKEVEFFVGQLSGGKYIGKDVKTVWTDKFGKAELPFVVLPGQFIMEKVNIIARWKTTQGNYYIAQRTTNVAIENR